MSQNATHRAPKSQTKGRRVLWAAIAVIIAWFAISGVTGPLFGKLSSVQQNDNAGFLPTSAESTKASELATKFTSQDTSILPALVIFTGPADAAGLAAVGEFGIAVATAPVEGTNATVGDYLADGAQLIPIPSQDGQAILMSIPLDNDALADPLETERPALPAVVEAIRAMAGEVPGFESHVTGIGGILADLFGSFGSIDEDLLRTTLTVVALILIFVYRSPVLWIIPLFSSVIALAAAGGVVYLLAKDGILDLDGQSQGILFVLVIGAATDYALLLIARYREELHHYESRVSAMIVAWKGVVEPIAASGLTVIAGLLVLGLSDLASVRSLGPVAAIGVLAAQLVMLTLLPAILVLAGRWVFWPKRPMHDDVDEKLSGLWSKVAGLVGRKPRATWIISGGFLIIAMSFATQLKTDGLATTDSFTGRPDSVIGLEKLSEHFPAGSGDPTIVIGPESDKDALIAALADSQGVVEVKQTTTPFIPGGPEPTPVVVDGLIQIEVILDKPADSVESQGYIPAIRDAVKAASATAVVGGSTAVNFDIQVTNERDRNLILPVALIVIAIILSILLRSIFAPILLLITTVISFGATLGISHLVFTHLFGFKGADGSFILFTFVFLVALGIDYNIFLMTRVREEAIKLGTRPGILKGLTVTGGVITSAGVVLAATFAVLGTLPLVFLAQLGFAVAFGVLLDTIIVRSLLVPALAYDIGAKIWWPSKLGKSEGPLLADANLKLDKASTS
jgi:putative drug exporter of the RND superfamily